MSYQHVYFSENFISYAGPLQPALRGPKFCGCTTDLIDRQIALRPDNSALSRIKVISANYADNNGSLRRINQELQVRHQSIH